jgi:phage/plasmid-associated DNA primase
MIRLVQALFKFSLTPKPNAAFPVEVFVYLLGKSGTGKSTLLEILQALAGDASTTWDSDKLSEASGRYNLVGKLIAVDTDLTGAISLKAMEILKKLASNEEVEARQLWHNGSSIRLGCVPWAAGTEEIITGQHGKSGVNRRQIKISLTRPIEKRDPELKAKLLKDLPGIWLWMEQITFDEAVQVINAYTNSDRNLDEMAQTLESNNTVYQWITSVTEDTETQCLNGASLGLQTHFNIYRRFCMSVGAHALRRKNMKDELENAGAIVTIEKSGAARVVIPPPEEVNRKRMLAL